VSANEPRVQIAQAAQTLAVPLTEEQLDLLLAYMGWLQKWNRVYNLTALRSTEDVLSHHLMDSLAAVPPLQRHLKLQAEGVATAAPEAVSVLDVGSGGGLPGVVLAICLPDVQVTCVDAVAKKAAFIQQVAAALRLANLKGLHGRVETVGPKFDVVTSRAFASLADFTAWSRKALKPGAVWMAMKGKNPVQELAVLGADVAVFHVEPLQVPGLDAERCIVWMRAA
jgi:16S rRNA (guanine527-N7)-methyltransferase